MASAGKGTVFTTADPAALSAAFASEANALARQIVVTAQLPAGFQQTSSNVDVSVADGHHVVQRLGVRPVRTAADIAAEKAAAAAPAPVTGARSPFPATSSSVRSAPSASACWDSSASSPSAAASLLRT